MSRRGLILPRLVPSALLLLVITGCSGANLGDIDEEVNSREQMPGPGIFADEDGETSLKWDNEGKQAEPSSTSNQAAVTATAAGSIAVTASPEQAEFEQFKVWNELRKNGADSPEYQEFLQWLEYQKFKSKQ